MNLKIHIFNQKNSLIFTVDKIKEKDIGKEVQECIEEFKKYYALPLNIEVMFY